MSPIAAFHNNRRLQLPSCFQNTNTSAARTTNSVFMTKTSLIQATIWIAVAHVATNPSLQGLHLHCCAAPVAHPVRKTAAAKRDWPAALQTVRVAGAGSRSSSDDQVVTRGPHATASICADTQHAMVIMARCCAQLLGSGSMVRPAKGYLNTAHIPGMPVGQCDRGSCSYGKAPASRLAGGEGG